MFCLWEFPVKKKEIIVHNQYYVHIQRIQRNYPLQCKACFHIKAHLNTCFDHIWRWIYKLGRACARTINKYIRNYMHLYPTHSGIEQLRQWDHFLHFIQTPSQKLYYCYSHVCLFVFFLLFLSWTGHGQYYTVYSVQMHHFYFHFNSLLTVCLKYIQNILAPCFTVCFVHDVVTFLFRKQFSNK